MTKLFKKTKRSNKKYGKKGGLFFTRTSKYRDMKSQRESLQDEINRLVQDMLTKDEELRKLNDDLKNCHNRYKPKASDYPFNEEDRIFNQEEGDDRIFNQEGGILGWSLASNYSAAKDEKINLEQRKNQLLQQLETAENNIKSLKNRITICNQINWNNEMELVREKPRKDSAERERQERERQEMMGQEREIDTRERQLEQPEPTVTCDPFGFCSSRGGKKRKTKKAIKKRKGSRRRH